ncbi:MAG: hypothetical protein JXA71_08600 [Chitinispirillaceae bacterium]|nr:hypothetical protein [Chitinispirillaceae bacterium]
MKKTVAAAAAIIALITLLAFVYLRIGTTAAEKGVEVMKESQGSVEQAKRSVEELNRSTEETKKALERMGK